MAARISLRLSGATQAQKRLASAARSVNPEQLRGIRQATVVVERHVKRVMLSGTPGSHPLFGRTGAASPTLGSVSGHLRRSVTSATFTAGVGAGSVVVGTVGTPVAYALTHEEGATITGNPWLRIPTRHAKTKAGVDRLTGVSARSDPSLFVAKSKAGNLWLVKQKGAAGRKALARRQARALAGEAHPSGGARGVKHRRTPHIWPGLVLMYLLVKSVTSKKRAPFAATLKEKRGEIVAILQQVGTRIAMRAGGR